MSEFIFCPRCGAVTKPGVCSNCGYTINKEENTVNNESEAADTSVNYVSDKGSSVEKSSPKSSKGWIVGLIIGILCVGFALLLVVVIALVIIVPFVFKTVYTVNGVTNNPSVVSTPNNNNPVIPGITVDEEDEDEEDEDNEDDTDTDDGDDDANPSDPDSNPDSDYDTTEYYYADTIEPLYSGTSKFDYEKFEQEVVPEANEYWDESAENTFDYFLNGNYSSYLKSYTSHNFIDRDGFSTPYYEYLVDSYIENDNYDVERRIIRFEGDYNGNFINAYCAYYTLSSDKVDFTDVNEAMRDQALSMLYDFITTSGNSSDTFNYTLYCDSVITFNNDEIVSVGYSATSYANNLIEDFNIHGINVDVKKGKVMDNTAILNFNDDFSAFFVERSNIQNSYVDAINYSDVSDITKVFNDDDSLILLFTPLGVEVGMNYRYQYNYGWVTITLNDFDQYFSHQYSFNTDWAKQYYDIYQYEKDNNIFYDPANVYEDVYYDL